MEWLSVAELVRDGGLALFAAAVWWELRTQRIEWGRILRELVDRDLARSRPRRRRRARPSSAAS